MWVRDPKVEKHQTKKLLTRPAVPNLFCTKDWSASTNLYCGPAALIFELLHFQTKTFFKRLLVLQSWWYFKKIVNRYFSLRDIVAQYQIIYGPVLVHGLGVEDPWTRPQSETLWPVQKQRSSEDENSATVTSSSLFRKDHLHLLHENTSVHASVQQNPMYIQ